MKRRRLLKLLPLASLVPATATCADFKSTETGRMRNCKPNELGAYWTVVRKGVPGHTKEFELPAWYVEQETENRLRLPGLNTHLGKLSIGEVKASFSQNIKRVYNGMDSPMWLSGECILIIENMLFDAESCKLRARLYEFECITGADAIYLRNSYL